MPRTVGRDVIRILHLPDWVDASVLAEVVEEVRLDPSVLLVLDFTCTRHIRYRDLQRFVEIVRGISAVSRTILFYGLSSYCSALCRFALRAQDWELFREVEPIVATMSAGGNADDVVSAVRGGRLRWLGNGRAASLSVPSLN